MPDTVDTLRLARRAFALPSYSLGAVARHRGLDAGLPQDMRPHRAAYDATVTARLFVDLATTLAPGDMTRDALLSAGAPARSSQQSTPARDSDQTLFDPFRPLTTP